MKVYEELDRNFPEKLYFLRYVKTLVECRIREVDYLYTLPRAVPVGIADISLESALWDAVLKGKTLVDVVAGIFTGVTSAVQAVKDGLSSAWNGIKSTGEFLESSLISTVVESVSIIIQNIIVSMSFISGAMSIKIIENVISANFGGYTASVGFEINGSHIDITIGDYVNHIDAIRYFEAETLTIKDADYYTNFYLKNYIVLWYSIIMSISTATYNIGGISSLFTLLGFLVGSIAMGVIFKVADDIINTLEIMLTDAKSDGVIDASEKVSIKSFAEGLEAWESGIVALIGLISLIPSLISILLVGISITIEDELVKGLAAITGFAVSSIGFVNAIIGIEDGLLDYSDGRILGTITDKMDKDFEAIGIITFFALYLSLIITKLSAFVFSVIFALLQLAHFIVKERIHKINNREGILKW